jgi:hypothetical protein
MMHQLRRHPFPVRAWFRRSLVLTYACPEAILRPLLPPGLELDAFENLGFVAIAIVQTQNLRPEFLPAWIGQDFFLAGYRIFTRFRTASGRNLRGLRILRSYTDRRLMACAGNLLTHYHYRRARVDWSETASEIQIRVQTPQAEADLDLTAFINGSPSPLPPGSPFLDERQARLFAGPLPFTFDYEPETHSMILIEGQRKEWHPVSVRVEVRQATFFEVAPFHEITPVLANAFMVSDIPYRWKRGVLEPLSPALSADVTSHSASTLGK